VLPLLANSHGGSTISVGLLFAVYAAALVAFTPLAAARSTVSGRAAPCSSG